MTMVDKLRNPMACLAGPRAGVANTLGLVVWLCLGTASTLFAQTPGVHYRHHGDMSPGAIGSWQLQRGGPLPGYFQPVEVRAPEGARIWLSADGQYIEPETASVKAGLLIGSVYRLRVTNIPYHEGMELYPTIEVIDRLYPPPGQAARFPIPIELTLEDMELALDGRYVVRVVYLEDPRLALPIAQASDQQIWMDAGPGNDPLRMADELGRPVAILRMGGRVPLDTNDVTCVGQPAPLIYYRATPPVEEVPRPSSDLLQLLPSTRDQQGE